MPTVGTDGGEGFVVLWNSSDGYYDDPPYSGVQGQHYGVDGSPIGGQFKVGSATDHDQRYSAISADGSGGFVVVWANYALSLPNGSRTDIHARRFGSDGTALGDDFRVNTYTTNDQTYPDVSLDGSGGFVVVWRSEGSAETDTDQSSVQGRRFSSSGQPRGEEFQINTYTTRLQHFPKVTSVSSGEFVVVWASSDSSGPDYSSSVQGQRFGSDGLPLSSEFQVNTYGYHAQDNPGISTFNSGFAVIWESSSSPNQAGVDSIRAQLFRSNGLPLGGEFQVNTNTGDRQYRSAVSPDGLGGFAVVWQTWAPNGPNSTGTIILAQRYDSTGSPAGTEFQIKDLTSNQQKDPEIGLSGNGEFVVAWKNFYDLGHYEHFRSIQAQRYALMDPWEAPFICVEDAETRCLQGGRFEVKVHWRTLRDVDGEGHVVSGGSSDSALFWFFNENNWEMLIKVLNGCSVNDHFWVFAAATTDVEYTLVVRDSFTGESSFYFNQLGVASPAITDTGAFATCP